MTISSLLGAIVLILAVVFLALHAVPTIDGGLLAVLGLAVALIGIGPAVIQRTG